MTKSLLALLAFSPALLAQFPGPAMRQPPWMNPPGQAGPITGKPLSATETYQITQTLADGTNMNTTSSGTFYRDEQGRMLTQNEKWGQIFDPVAGVTAGLNTPGKSCRQRPIPAGAVWSWVHTVENGGGGSATYDKEKGPGVGPNLPVNGGDAPVTTALPAKTINGIWVTGNRTTVNIPSGAAGNNQPIQIVRDLWYSSDFGVLVQSTTTDPRYGTATYTLTDVKQGAPDASLLRIPADCTLVPLLTPPGKK